MTTAASASGPGFYGLPAVPSRRSCRAAVVAAPGAFSRAVIAASALVELYDEELEFEPFRRGILTETVPPGRLGSRLRALLARGVFACLIGYPSFPAPLAGGKDYRRTLLTPEFRGPAEGAGTPELVVGPRRGRPEGFGAGSPVVLTAREISTGAGAGIPGPARRTPSLLTVDPLVMDPSLLPVRANIEPGGLQWYPLTGILRSLLRGGDVAAALITPCRLPAADGAPAFIVARLAARILACALAER